MEMEEQFIADPRPLFVADDAVLEHKKNVERLFMGSGSSGIIFDVTSKGIEVNGYYEGFTKRTRYANLRKPVFIPWEELDKAKQKAVSSNKTDKSGPDFIDGSPDIKYLETLPVVHINNKKYYIDGIRKERRLVDRPQDVYKF